MASRQRTSRPEFPNPIFGDGQQELVAGRPRLHEYRCCGCCYGARCLAAPERCPMCGGSVWDYLPGDAVSSSGHEPDALAPLTRERP